MLTEEQAASETTRSLERANERLDAEVVMLRNRLARLLQAAREMDDGLTERNWAIVAAHAALEGTGL